MSMPHFLRTPFALLITGVLLLGSCTGNQSTTETTSSNEQATEADLPPAKQVKVAYQTPDAFKTQLGKVVEAYLATKDALVATDAAQTDQKTGELLTALGQVDATSLPADAGEKWTEHRKIMERAATSMQAAGNVEAKRTSFEDLSKAAYALVNDFGAGTTLYKEYCPMAFNDKGAFWLSAKSEIKNPYFGDKMLECGEVQEVLTFQEGVK
jgi:Cu(I)/Ag(I) efflux system membrane fusion protein